MIVFFERKVRMCLFFVFLRPYFDFKMQNDNYLTINRNAMQMIGNQSFRSSYIYIYIYIYIFLIINKLRKFFLFTFIYISKPPKSERCASLNLCAIRPAWLFIRN